MGFYIYKHILDGEVVYVGKTTNMENRQKAHNNEKDWFKEGLKIEYAEVNNKTSMDIYELYYINKIAPKFNKSANRRDDISSLNLKDLDFKEYKYTTTYVKNKKKKLGELSSCDIDALQSYERDFLLRILGFRTFRFYCDLIYILEKSNNVLKTDFVIKNIRSIKANLDVLQYYGILKYEKIGIVYIITPINLWWKDCILKLKEDFYENLNLSDACWAVYFISYCFEYLNYQFNPFFSACSMDNTIYYFTGMNEQLLKRNIEGLKSIGYNVGINYKNSTTYKLVKLYDEYHCLTNSCWEDEEYRKNRLSKFNYGFEAKYEMFYNDFIRA